MIEASRPLLIYDGECEFCCYCVDFVRRSGASHVHFEPFQSVAADHPEISPEDFRASIQLLHNDGRRSSGALAAFETLALAKRTRFWLLLYQRLPLFAVVAESAYRWVSTHRGSSYRLCRLLFGTSLEPASLTLTHWLFLRLLALVYLAAFASLATQAMGLFGEEGILPIGPYLTAVDASYGAEKYWLLPTLFWLNSSDAAIQWLPLVGCLLSVLLLLNRFPRSCLLGLYILYLSLVAAGQDFMTFQWDILLLECGFLALFLGARPRLFTWIFRWLLFRFMLQSGVVKLLSGDLNWRGLTALDYHFETQPLPTVLAWYAHQLPELVLRAGVVFTFAIELLVPFLILMPRRPRAVAAVLICSFQLMIIVSGSYNFFNFLTVCLCLLLLDDQFLREIVPPGLVRRLAPGASVVSPSRARFPVAVAVLYLGISATLMAASFRLLDVSSTVRQLVSWSMPAHIANNYGVFAVMTTQRAEVILEGSRDGKTWRAYELPYKPGATDRAPVWATPHQPRLDWQLWFAALAPAEQNPWLRRLQFGLLSGSAPILKLFSYNPFPQEPPLYIRASLYRYHFSDRETRRQTGHWWTREYAGVFMPAAGLVPGSSLGGFQEQE
jgi:predicted DCC family thiol-disulfide oxidoreductase YuxK